MNVPYTNLSIKGGTEIDEILRRIEKILREGQYIFGEELEEFERNFASFCGVKYAIGVNSGTDALFLSLKALAIESGDEVITVGNSYIATVSAIVHAGAKPVLVDVRYDDMLINPALIEEKITRKTKVIIPVHLTGLPCDMDSIREIARKYDLFVVEDACQSIDARYLVQKTGGGGTIGCFSFHPLKNLPAMGDGGMITTNDETLLHKLKMLRNHGLKDRDTALTFGYNSRLDAIHAAVLNYRLSRINEITAIKRRLAKLYDEHLMPLKEEGIIDYFLEDEDRKNVFHLFVIKTKRRNELKSFLERLGIETKIHYPIPIHRQKAFTDRFGEIALPVTERLSHEILSLPIWTGMDDRMVEEVCRAIQSFFTE